jgi:hypothetical protein
MGGLDRGAPHTLISVTNPLLTRNFDTLSKQREPSAVDDDCWFLSSLGGTEDARLALNLAATASCADAPDRGKCPSPGDMAGDIFSVWAILYSLREKLQSALTKVCG